MEKAEKEAQVELQASEITTSEERLQKQLQQIEVYGIYIEALMLSSPF